MEDGTRQPFLKEIHINNSLIVPCPELEGNLRIWPEDHLNETDKDHGHPIYPDGHLFVVLSITLYSLGKRYC